MLAPLVEGQDPEVQGHIDLFLNVNVQRPIIIRMVRGCWSTAVCGRVEGAEEENHEVKVLGVMFVRRVGKLKLRRYKVQVMDTYKIEPLTHKPCMASLSENNIATINLTSILLLSSYLVYRAPLVLNS